MWVAPPEGSVGRRRLSAPLEGSSVFRKVQGRSWSDQQLSVSSSHLRALFPLLPLGIYTASSQLNQGRELGQSAHNSVFWPVLLLHLSEAGFWDVMMN